MVNWRFPRFGYKITHSEWFEKMAKKSFDDVDVDHDEKLDVKELYIALLQLYDMLNTKLPCHVVVPNLKDVEQLMELYDADKSGYLQYPEYLKLCRGLIGTRKNWRQSLVLKVSLAVAFKCIGIPLGALLISKGFVEIGKMVGHERFAKRVAHTGVASILVETAVKPLYSA